MIRRQAFRKIKKDYRNKNLQNPFFKRPKQGTGSRFLKLIIVGIFILIITVVWFLFSSAFWRIKNIKIEGLTRAQPVEIENLIYDQMKARRYLLFKQSNLFLFDKMLASQTILGNYNFANLEIDKSWPKTLKVKISEKPYAFIFQEGNNFFFASADAYLIKEVAVTEEDKKKYFILENKSPNSLLAEQDKISIKANYLNFILNLYNNLVVYPELPIERLIIDQEFNTIKVKFVSGPEVFFNTQTEALSQVNRLLLVKREKIKDNFSKIKYIDLRYGGRVFINYDPQTPNKL